MGRAMNNGMIWKAFPHFNTAVVHNWLHNLPGSMRNFLGGIGDGFTGTQEKCPLPDMVSRAVAMM